MIFELIVAWISLHLYQCANISASETLWLRNADHHINYNITSSNIDCNSASNITTFVIELPATPEYITIDYVALNTTLQFLPFIYNITSIMLTKNITLDYYSCKQGPGNWLVQVSYIIGLNNLCDRLNLKWNGYYFMTNETILDMSATTVYSTVSFLGYFDICEDLNGCTNKTCTLLESFPGYDCVTMDAQACISHGCYNSTCVSYPISCNNEEGAYICKSSLNPSCYNMVNCDDSLTCTNDYCDLFTESCVFIDACPGDMVCTPNSASGYCAFVSSTCDDGIQCTHDSITVTGECVHEVLCNDGIDCTSDICSFILNNCTHVDICDDALVCTIDSCGSDGICHYYDTCGGDKTCTSAGCIGGAIECDDQISCTADGILDNGTCIHVNTCDGGLYCNTYLCDSSGCHAISRCDDGRTCTMDSCIPTADVGGICNYVDQCPSGYYCNRFSECVIYNTKCDDGVACTDDGLDENGLCFHKNLCTDGLNCTLDICNSNGTCSYISTCADQWVCTIDTCTLSGCSYAVSCDAGMQCDIDGHCSYTSQECDDGKSCTYDSMLPNGTCINTQTCALPCYIGSCGAAGDCEYTPVDCSDGLTCTDDYCVNSTGMCANKIIHTNGEGCDLNGNSAFISPMLACNDGKNCTKDSINSIGVCQHALSCNDGLACTDDYCGRDGSCTYTVNCAPSSCMSGTCGDGGLCVYASLCGDGMHCKYDGTCAVDPNQVSCTSDRTCAISYSNVYGECQSIDMCASYTACMVGICLQNGTCSEQIMCDDGLICTDDFCTHTGSCGHSSNCGGDLICNSFGECIDPDESCDDGIMCTLDLYESDGTCTHLQNCDDGLQCTDDSCNLITGICDHISNCNDTIRCTVNTCDKINGNCISTVNCMDHTICDSTGECVEEPPDKSLIKAYKTGMIISIIGGIFVTLMTIGIALVCGITKQYIPIRITKKKDIEIKMKTIKRNKNQAGKYNLIESAMI